MRRSLLPFLSLILSACTTFRNTPPESLPTPVLATERFEVWSGGLGHRWQALRVTTDSVSGVQWWQNTACDSCRVSLARTDVDSIRAEDPVGEGDPLTVMALLVPVAVVLYLLRGFFGN